MLTIKRPLLDWEQLSKHKFKCPGFPAVHTGRAPGQTLQVTFGPQNLACDDSYKQGFLSFSLCADTWFGFCVASRPLSLTGCSVSDSCLQLMGPGKDVSLPLS